MRRRRETAAVEAAQQVDPEARAQAKAQLERWVKTTGRMLTGPPKDALPLELQRSHAEEYRLLTPADVDELVALALEYGPEPVSYPRQRELAALTVLVRDQGATLTRAQFEQAIAAAEHVEPEDHERLRAVWAAYRSTAGGVIVSQTG